MAKQNAILPEFCQKSGKSKLYDDWTAIPWAELERQVTKLQRRIHRAQREGNNKQVRKLQRILIHSKANLLISIKKITTVNRGRKTAGVDKMVITTDKERIELYHEMVEEGWEDHNPSPALRKNIPKKNGKTRPLSIPTIKDRIWQNVFKNALEPEWEAQFEPISYGFRPKRSPADAIERIAKAVRNGKRTWIFEGDFKGCFDNINHSYLLEKIKEFPGYKMIKKWLKAGIIDNGVFQETEAGTAQGSVISPLLCNIALHGMEETLGVTYKRKTDNNKKDIYGIPKEHNEITGKYTVVRYADDFVVLCKTQEDANEVYSILKPYLKERGLELQYEKTKVTRLEDGFDFLGFTIRQFKSKENLNRTFKTIIRPSKESIKQAKAKIKEIFKQCTGLGVDILITKLNPVIRGIGQYWSTTCAKEAFNDIDYFIWSNTVRFLKHLHPQKPWKWIVKQYFHPDPTGVSKSKWILTNPDNKYSQLTKMIWQPIKYHRMIRFDYSPFDYRYRRYFEDRDKREMDIHNPKHRQKLAKRQDYKCPFCGQLLTSFDQNLDVHHKIPRCKDGNNKYSNLQLVHNSCHIEYHRWFPAKLGEPTKESFEEFTYYYQQLLWGKVSA